MRWIVAYLAAGAVFGVLDALWLRWAGPNLYRPVIGEIMAAQFRVAPAAAFYLLYLAGMVWFAVRPGIESGQVSTALINGALLGGLCYATFDLTSQAVMKVWSTQISVMDIAWGAFATAIASAAAVWAALRFAS